MLLRPVYTNGAIHEAAGFTASVLLDGKMSTGCEWEPATWTVSEYRSDRRQSIPCLDE